MYNGRKTFSLSRPKAAWKSLVLITIFSASCRWSRGRLRVASVLLQQLPLGLTEAVALPLSGRGMARHPPGDRTGILAGLVGRDDAVQLLQAPPQSGEVDQAMPRGMGGDQRAVQGATTGGGQALRHGPFQDLTMKGLQQWSDPVAEGIPAAARGRDPQSQPLKAATIARVFRPLVRRMMAGLDLVQGDLEHQIGPMGLGAHAEIGGEQESQIELIDRLVDGAGAMVGGQGVLDREPLGGPRIPGRHGEAIEFGTVLGWRRVDRYREVERAARPVERAMVLRSRWEYHSSRAPFEGAGYPFAILRRGSPYSLYPLEPAESGTISVGVGRGYDRGEPSGAAVAAAHEPGLHGLNRWTVKC